MSTTKEFLQFALDQLSGLDQIAHRQMMGEYIVYYQGKIAAYICDNRFLVKPVEAARTLLPEAPLEPPYPGAKEMLLVEDLEDKAALTASAACAQAQKVQGAKKEKLNRSRREPAETGRRSL